FYGGSSYTPGGAKPLLVPLGQESHQPFPQLRRELKDMTGMDIQFATGPKLRSAMTEEEEGRLTGIAAEARDHGFDAKWISGDEVRSMENTLTEEVRGAVLGYTGYVEPYRYTLALAQGAEKMGANIKYAQAVGFQCEKDRVASVKLSTGKAVSAGTVVIAMGPWSGVALSWLGLNLPLTSLRAQTMKLVASRRPGHQMSFAPLMPGEWPHVFMIFSPRADGSIFAGYTEDRTENWDDTNPDTWTDAPSEDMTQIMLEQTLRFLPILEDAEIVEQRSAVLAAPPTEGMVIGPVPNWENVYLATIGDNGIAVSAAVGRIMTDLIAGGGRAEKALEEVKTVSPGRFLL
ncbi:MAG: FAD-binding oxidoreductase, partial [Deltaproteobacteria bacterium]|nr:FAD-binding oxidoreductase [Deltaproteobacteria bacterium]